MRDNEYQSLEHRLTKIEAALNQALVLLSSINGRLSILETWRRVVEIQEARAQGMIEGRTNLRRRDVAILMGVFVMAGTLSGILFNVSRFF